MKSKDIKNLQSKTKEELTQLIKDLKKEVFSLRLDLAQNKLKNPRAIFNARKDIARAMSVLGFKEAALKAAEAPVAEGEAK